MSAGTAAVRPFMSKPVADKHCPKITYSGAYSGYLKECEHKQAPDAEQGRAIRTRAKESKACKPQCRCFGVPSLSTLFSV